MTSNKRPRSESHTIALGKVHSQAELKRLCGQDSIVDLPESGVYDLKTNLALSEDTARCFLKGFAPQLTLADWLIRIKSHGEKARYLLVYEVLKEYLRFGRGRFLKLEAATVAEAISASPRVNKLFIGFEEALSDGNTSGRVEFLIRDSAEDDAKIKFVVEVKYTLSPESADESTYQLFAELITACNFNLADDGCDGEVWGALTDAYTWQFFKLTRVDKCYKIVRAQAVTLFEHEMKSSETTIQSLILFFSALFPDLSSLTEEELRDARYHVDDYVSHQATRFTDSALNSLKVSRLEREAAERDRELAERDRELAERGRELAELKATIVELRRAQS